ncbi:hypothetical protein NHX12_007289 [Muraenolepis orangiensis]|uniref:Uncharacterized protein n=1 Tax=Muraenolepis orangiensis TaxID=630683 RepID=A0A9Q0DS24_9TELE|nr:hypothetical protein NHX12_007289 [Muraenolepis orangiensis]
MSKEEKGEEVHHARKAHQSSGRATDGDPGARGQCGPSPAGGSPAVEPDASTVQKGKKKNKKSLVVEAVVTRS